MDAAEYKHTVLGLIFLKYISDSFEFRRSWLINQTADSSSEHFVSHKEQRAAVLEDRDEYISENVFWVPPDARWETVQKQAKHPERFVKGLPQPPEIPAAAWINKPEEIAA